MGCFGSRFDKRNSVADDFNTVGIQFVGGEGQKADKCPLDSVCLMYGDSKEVEEWLKVGPLTMTAEEEGKKIALEAWRALCQQAKYLDDEFGGKDKVVYVNGKYESKSAIAQIKAVKEFLKEKNPDIEFPEEEKPAEEGMMMEGEMGEMMMEDAPAEMEGGEGMEEPDLYAGDSAAYDGWANLPALFLRCMTVHPYFGDIVKSALIYYEFNFGGKQFVPLPKIGLGDFTKNPLAAKEPETAAWAGIAALVGCAVDAAEATETDVWFSGYLGDEDVQALEAIEENGSILFPGWMAGWKSEDEAKKGIWECNGKNTVHKVIIVAKTKCKDAVVCRLFSQRFNAKKTSFEKKEDIWYLTVADDGWEYKTLADWKVWLKEEEEKAVAAAAAAAAEKTGEAVMEGAEMAEMAAEEMAAAE
jgi:hypothetical protein